MENKRVKRIKEIENKINSIEYEVIDKRVLKVDELFKEEQRELIILYRELVNQIQLYQRGI